MLALLPRMGGLIPLTREAVQATLALPWTF